MTKQLPFTRGRSLRATTPCYTRSIKREKQLILGPKPGILKGLRSLDEKMWRKYQTLLKRQESPLDRAEYYARELKERGIQSFQALSLLLGEPLNRVGRHIRLLGLPSPIKTYLREHREPHLLRYFTERRLGELVSVEARSAWRRFREMVAEAERRAKRWRNGGR